MSTPERRLLIVALLVRLIPAWLIYGSVDVQNWNVLGRVLLDGENIYETKYAVAWPPLWVSFAAFAHIVADSTRFPFHVVVKSFPIAADVITTFVLFANAPRFGGDPYRTAMLFALNPVAVYVCAIHGQFDPIPALCVLLAVVAASSQNAGTTMAGVWAGIGAAFKTWPLLVLPALLTPARRLRDAAATVAWTVGLFAVALIVPALFVGFEPVRHTFAYRGFAGWWGLTSFAELAGTPLPDVWAGRVFDASMLIVALHVLARRMSPPAGAMLLLLTFYVMTPGFGLQYLIWILPLAILFDRRHAAVYTVLASSMLLFENLLRPHAGYLGDMFSIVPHQGYARALAGERDLLITRLDRLPLWIFFAYWWTRTAFARMRATA